MGFVRVVVGEVDVSRFLQFCVEPTVVDAKADEFDLLAMDGAGGDGGVLLLNVVGELGTVVSTVGFGEDAEVAVLVLGELGVEGLEECPDVRGGGNSGVHLAIAVGEASPDGLVDVEHVGDAVPRVGVERGGGVAVDEVARPVLHEEPDHRRAAGATIEPGCQRGGRGIVAGFKEPEPPTQGQLICSFFCIQGKVHANMFMFLPTDR